MHNHNFALRHMLTQILLIVWYQIPTIPSVFQLQCLGVNAYILTIWFVDYQRFIRNHTFFMVVVWTSQLVNRFIGSLLMPLAAERLFHLHPLLQLMAANGPEKLLLASTPVVGTMLFHSRQIIHVWLRHDVIKCHCWLNLIGFPLSTG